MPIDIEEFLPHLDGLDLPKYQKEDLLRSLALIAQGFVDREFGKLPSQQLELKDSKKSLRMIYLQSNPKSERNTI